MGRTLAIMFTFTTYGTWLRGDPRGWVEKGIVYPPDPEIQQHDAARMNHPVFKFSHPQRAEAAIAMAESLRARLGSRIYALCVQSWHSHVVVDPVVLVAEVAKCAKDAVRWKLRLDRPIWGDGYDKRFCFDERAVRTRIDYVERHNLRDGLPRRPWDFIEDFPYLGGC